jgi:hypothetical protein
MYLWQQLLTRSCVTEFEATADCRSVVQQLHTDVQVYGCDMWVLSPLDRTRHSRQHSITPKVQAPPHSMVACRRLFDCRASGCLARLRRLIV